MFEIAILAVILSPSFGSDIQVVHVDPGDDGEIHIPIKAGELSMPISGMRLSIEASNDIFILPDSVLGPVDMQPSSISQFRVHYFISKLAKPGKSRLVISHAAFDELMDNEAPEIIEIAVSTRVVGEVEVPKAEINEQPEMTRIRGKNGEEKVAWGPSPAAWVRADVSRIAESVEKALRSTETRWQCLDRFKKNRAGVIEAYKCSLDLDASYQALISSVSAPNRMHKYPEAVWRSLQVALAKSSIAAGISNESLRQSQAKALKFRLGLEAQFPDLSESYLHATRPQSPDGRVLIAPLIKIERSRKGSALDAELLMLIAQCDQEIIRTSALIGLDSITDKPTALIPSLMAMAFPSDGSEQRFMTADRAAAITALGSYGKAADVAVEKISALLPEGATLIGQVELPIRALKRIGTRKALRLVDQYERQEFERSGRSTGVPKEIRGWKGVFSGIRDSEIVLVRDEPGWKALWRRHAPEMPLPAIDFSREMVFGVFLGATHREFLRLQDLANDEVGLKITYGILHPDFVADNNYEFLLARIPRTNSRVTVKEFSQVAMSRRPSEREEIKRVFEKWN